MITPNKVVPLSASVLGHLTHVLKAGPDPTRLADLFQQVGDQFESIDQFLLALDVLFLLDRLTVDFGTEKVVYAA
ncbi:ABC-three component system middle component 7 [Rubrivivax gelatinosus]|uniref:ABC-three component system middle component 7 n=1 Tax=Rubrivivax gelatinosus TaxID=28068 RepID=UPI0005C256A2|nr:ABC-three component system middle component 7 [Rubrivivax gelatinosus]